MNPKVWTKPFTISIVLLLVAATTGILQYYYSDYAINRAAYWSLSLANIMAWNYLYRNGTFSKSRWRNIQFLFLAIFIIAILFKIQHWRGANLMLSVTWVGSAIFYTIWFSAKEVKTLLDILKWIWVLFFSILTWMKNIHVFDSDWYGSVFLTSLLYFIYIKIHLLRVLSPTSMDRDSEWDFDKI